MAPVRDQSQQNEKPKRRDYMRKLAEAGYFLGQMQANEEFDEPFRYNLSAFLTAARSVLQFAQKEVEGAPGQSWYEGLMQKDLLRYMKGVRDDNIHAKSVDLGITFREELTLVVGDVEGAWGPPRSSVQRHFRDRDDERIVQLCKSYLKHLWEFVTEGAGKAYIGVEADEAQECQ